MICSIFGLLPGNAVRGRHSASCLHVGDVAFEIGLITVEQPTVLSGNVLDEPGEGESPTECRYVESGLDFQGTTEASTAVKTRGGVVIHKDTAEAAVAEDRSA